MPVRGPATSSGQWLGAQGRPVEHRQADDAVARGAAIAKCRYRRRDSDSTCRWVSLGPATGAAPGGCPGRVRPGGHHRGHPGRPRLRPEEPGEQSADRGGGVDALLQHDEVDAVLVEPECCW